MYFEDNDLCDKTIEKNKSIIEIPESKMIHLQGLSADNSFLQNCKLSIIHKISEYIYYKKKTNFFKLYKKILVNFFDYLQRFFINIIKLKFNKSFKNLLRILSIILYISKLYIFILRLMEKLNIIKMLFNRIYYFLFVERFNKKLKLEFPPDIYRWDLIQHIIDKYNFKDYLEIGCDKNQSFSKIKIDNKIGVDPIEGGTIRSTSDQFFDQNKNNFDIIFIDGLHHYSQVLKDINNSLKILNKNGFILVHDCLPRSLAQQAVPRYRASWNGDVWKAIVELRTKNNLNIFTSQIDFGVAIIQISENKKLLKLDINNFSKLKFKDYYYNYKEFMNILDYEETLNKI